MGLFSSVLSTSIGSSPVTPSTFVSTTALRLSISSASSIVTPERSSRRFLTVVLPVTSYLIFLAVPSTNNAWSTSVNMLFSCVEILASAESKSLPSTLVLLVSLTLCESFCTSHSLIIELAGISTFLYSPFSFI